MPADYIYWLCSNNISKDTELCCVVQSVFVYWVTSNTWSFLQSIGKKCRLTVTDAQAFVQMLHFVVNTFYVAELLSLLVATSPTVYVSHNIAFIVVIDQLYL